ncbi:hypothetical protein Bca4012_056453 [Brassica carinata]
MVKPKYAKTTQVASENSSKDDPESSTRATAASSDQVPEPIAPSVDNSAPEQSVGGGGGRSWSCSPEPPACSVCRSTMVEILGSSSVVAVVSHGKGETWFQGLDFVSEPPVISAVLLTQFSGRREELRSE